MELLFASSNKNKIREISQLLPEGYFLLGLQDIGIVDEIPEPGKTIAENSLLKAQFVAQHLKNIKRDMPVFADDSGLEVEALDNAPGVYSARYAGVPKNEKANNEKLLKELTGKNNRRARFVTIITLILKEKIYCFEGEVKGQIQHALAGANGFGYDPLFVADGYTETFAQISPEKKNAISHRGQALKKLIAFIGEL